MKQADIDAAFANKLATFAKTPIGALTWSFTDEDRDETPVEGVPYMRGSSVMGDQYVGTIAGPGSIYSRQEAFYQVDLYYPKSKQSPRKMRECADLVSALFWDHGPKPVFYAGEYLDIPRKPAFKRLSAEGVYLCCCVTVYFTNEDVAP